MSDITKDMLLSLLPPGSAWTPEEAADFDLLLDGMADNYEDVRVFLSQLADLRNPLKTPILSDLEREYGIPTDLTLSEDIRRQRLAAIVYAGQSRGTIDDLQDALDASGFNIQVYENDPAVDPAIFLDQAFQMVAGGGNAYAGRADAFAGRVGGELLVNGDLFQSKKLFTSVAGTMYAGTATAGEYEDLEVTKIEYPIPTDPNDWPLVFFVGGPATLGFIELLLNGDFETGDYTGWTQNGGVIDNTNPASGTWCSKLVAAGASVTGPETVSYDVRPDRIYTIKAKNDVTAYVAGTYLVRIDFRDKDDLFIGAAVLNEWSALTGGYVQSQKTIGPPGSGADFVMPANTAKIRIRDFWTATPTGTAFMDDVEFFRSDKQSILDIEQASVDGTREDEFKRLILQYKPIHTWAALIVDFN